MEPIREQDADLARDSETKSAARAPRMKPGERRVHILQTLAAMLEAPKTEKITTAALAIMGFLPQADTFWGWVPLFSGDTWLHAAASLAAGLVGYVAAEPASVEPAPLPATPAR